MTFDALGLPGRSRSRLNGWTVLAILGALPIALPVGVDAEFPDRLGPGRQRKKTDAHQLPGFGRGDAPMPRSRGWKSTNAASMPSTVNT